MCLTHPVFNKFKLTKCFWAYHVFRLNRLQENSFLNMLCVWVCVCCMRARACVCLTLFVCACVRDCVVCVVCVIVYIYALFARAFVCCVLCSCVNICVWMWVCARSRVYMRTWNFGVWLCVLCAGTLQVLCTLCVCGYTCGCVVWVCLCLCVCCDY